MLWAIRQLATPTRYLLIRQGGTLLRSKAVYDWIAPALLATLSVVAHGVINPNVPILADEGIIGGFQKLLELLVPFFIAALAAVATFDRPGLDQTMKGDPAILHLRRAVTGTLEPHVLTRRQFICYLFGYLAFLSLLLFLAILFVALFKETISQFSSRALGEYVAYGKALGLFVFLFPIWQLIVTTLLGVYFLCDRLQTMDDPGR